MRLTEIAGRIVQHYRGLVFINKFMFHCGFGGSNLMVYVFQIIIFIQLIVTINHGMDYL